MSAQEVRCSRRTVFENDDRADDARALLGSTGHTADELEAALGIVALNQRWLDERGREAANILRQMRQ